MSAPPRHKPDGRWYRLVPSQYPPVLLYESVLDSEDYEAAWQLERMTNDRRREEAGIPGLVPEADRVFGPGTTPIMAAFTHIGHPSRFTDGSYGVYYAADSVECAIAESIHARERILRENNSPAQVITMRSYSTTVTMALDNIRGGGYARYRSPEISSYSKCQAYAAKRKAAGSNGLLYLSARKKDGECIAIFRPPAITPVRQAAHYQLHWNGSKITGWNKTGPHHPVF